MEFVILTGFMLLAFLVFYIVIQSKLVEANTNNVDSAAKQVELLVVNELKMAESVTDGYYREFELPSKIGGINYAISIMPGVSNTPEIVVKYNGRERVYFVSQVNGSAGYVDGTSRVGIGKNNITKNNGLIIIQNMT
jgi:hypothetical protein